MTAALRADVSRLTFRIAEVDRVTSGLEGPSVPSA
jgi:hypothetical protein